MGREKAGRGGGKMPVWCGGVGVCVCVCVCITDIRKCSHAFRNEMYKKWIQWKNTNCHSAGDSGLQESSVEPAGEQGSRSLVTGSQHVARPAGCKHLEASLWTSQQEPGTEQRAGGWGGSQAGYLAAARGQLVRELTTQSHKKGLIAFSLLPYDCSHILMGKMKHSFSKVLFWGKG